MTRVAIWPILRLVLATLVLHLFLVQPNHPAAMTWGALFVFPLELPVIVFGLFALGAGSLRLGVRVALTFALTLIAVLKAADFGMFTALTRGFNPVADLPLIDASLRLMSGALGPVLAAGVVVGAFVVTTIGAFAIWWATGVWAKTTPTVSLARGSAVAAVLVAVIAVAEVGKTMGRWSLPFAPPGTAFTARVGVERIDMVFSTLADLRTFRAAAIADPYTEMDGLLDAIDRDVLVIFVESYGRTSLDTPFYAEIHRNTLEQSAARLGDLGLSMRSGLLAAPTRGGQSWLSHATFANGLWISDQTRYGAALASGRSTLFHMADRAGFRTAAVMPQITLDWPEADFMGFETVLAAKDLGYRGLPFNWVTMPDQYTLAAADRLLRTNDDDRHLFAQIALSSSHAPWVPVPELVDWEAMGDGQIFDAMALSGDAPDVVWRDRDRVRAQYRLAIDYALRSVFDYAARHAEDPPLLFILGDHQAAGFVALDERPDVPIHVIGPEHLVSKVSEWGWSEGLVPSPDTRVAPMDQMRDMILDVYTGRDTEETAG
ncbi:sulfatase-like hydrolase/transferase [Marivita sp.]|uniref:sulfatase-like hydrolase/transferase n=1 Tax=Marivita sp. TaxID=2003365 RepID=UPI003F6F8ED9